MTSELTKLASHIKEALSPQTVVDATIRRSMQGPKRLLKSSPELEGMLSRKARLLTDANDARLMGAQKAIDKVLPLPLELAKKYPGSATAKGLEAHFGKRHPTSYDGPVNNLRDLQGSSEQLIDQGQALRLQNMRDEMRNYLLPRKSREVTRLQETAPSEKAKKELDAWADARMTSAKFRREQADWDAHNQAMNALKEQGAPAVERGVRQAVHYVKKAPQLARDVAGMAVGNTLGRILF